MTDRERLLKLIQKAHDGCVKISTQRLADYLLANGVILPPCRCKDCTYLRESGKTNRVFCTYHGDYHEFETTPDHYCSEGVPMLKGV